jgi:mono/diheme cytochrome c family protein
MMALHSPTTLQTIRRIAFAAIGLLSLVANVDARPNDPALVEGRTLRDSTTGCNSCHPADAAISVTISGPNTIFAGSSANYTITATKSGQTNRAMGMVAAISLTGPTLSESTAGIENYFSDQIVHNSNNGALARTNASGSASYTITVNMPSGATGGSTHSLNAISRLGANGWANAVAKVITAVTVPGAPTSLAASVASGQTTLTYGAASANGASVTNYSATCSASMQPTRTASGNALALTVTGLANSVAYTCEVRATNAAGLGAIASVSVTPQPAAQTVTFPQQVPDSRVFVSGSTFPISPLATASSGLAITYSTSSANTICTVSGTTVTMAGVGTCTLVATQPGNGSFAAASASQNVVLTGAAPQSITFPEIVPNFYSISPGRQYEILPGATASSALPITYVSLTTAVCTISGERVVPQSPGTCTIEATQPGDANFAEAPPQSRSMSFGSTVAGVWPPGGVLPSGWSAGAGSSANWFVATDQAYEGSTSLRSGEVSANQTSSIQFSANMAAGQVTFYRKLNNCPSTGGGFIFLCIGVSPTYRVFVDNIEQTALTTNGNGNQWELISIPVTAGVRTIRFEYRRNPGSGGFFGSSLSGIFYIDQLTFPGAQTITTPSQFTQSYSPRTANFIGSIASSGLPVTYESVTPAVCTIPSAGVARIRMVAPGTCVISAGQAGNASFAPVSTLLFIGIDNAVIDTWPPNGVMPTDWVSVPTHQTWSLSTSDAFEGLVSLVTNPMPDVATSSPGDQIASIQFTANVTAGNLTFYRKVSTEASWDFFRVYVDGFEQTAVAMSGESDWTFVSIPLAAGIRTVRFSYLKDIECCRGGQDKVWIDGVSIPFASRLSQTITFPTPTNVTYAPGGTLSAAAFATASSGLPIVYSVASPSAFGCSVSGTTITFLTAGTCSIIASQGGNLTYSPATSVLRSFTINPASQVITFASLPNKFTTDPAFLISATGGASGQPVTFTVVAPSVCTLTGSAVALTGAVGTCTIRAEQLGTFNYLAATPVERTFSVLSNLPSAPTGLSATPGIGQAILQFTAPTSSGSSTVESYTATCTATGQPTRTGSSPSTSITVTGMVGGVTYACSVVANNASGAGAASTPVNVTPSALSGPQLWTTTCSGCHGATPVGTRFNAAGTTSAVLAYVRANQSQMLSTPNVQSLTPSEMSALAEYIAGFVPVINVTTATNTAKVISVGSHLKLNTISFTSAQVVTGPTNGTVGAFSGTNITYTPNPGFTGTDTFTYRGRRTSPSLVQGDVRTVTINVVASTVTLTVNRTGNGGGTVDSNPFGIVECNSSCTESFTPGTVVTLTASATAPTLFTGWKDIACAGGNNNASTCTITLNANTTVNAQFKNALGPRNDLNGDGFPDVLVQAGANGASSALMLSGTTVDSTVALLGGGLGWTITHTGDLDGDGKADLLWRNTDGTAVAWLMDGGTVKGAITLIGAGSGWSITRVADFDADGRDDILWTQTDGSVAIWLMDGLTLKSGAGIFGPSAVWSVIHTGDLNGDGKADIVWRNTDGSIAVWLMDGFVVTSGGGILGANTVWTLSHLADFDGDGKADILWQNSDGSIAIWLMDGTTVLSGGSIFGTQPAGARWVVTHTGDFDADGRADLVWRFVSSDGANGTVAIWLMDGLNLVSGSSILAGGGGWSVMAVRDYDQDGQVDILWQRVTDSRVTIWLMSGLTRLSSGIIIDVSGTIVRP